MACQSIARTAWYDAESGVGVHDGACHFVYGAVASDSHNHVYAVILSLGGYLRGVSGVFGYCDFIFKLLFVKKLVDQSGDGSLVRRA